MIHRDLTPSEVIQAVKNIVGKESRLLRSLAKVKQVLNEGYYINAELILKSEGLEEYQNIPVLKNQYCNFPIMEGDLVILLTLSHLLQGYLETETFNSPEAVECYFALPFSLLNNFTFKNQFQFVTPEKNAQGFLNEQELNVECKAVDFNIKTEGNVKSEIQGNSESTIQGNYKVENQGNMTIKSATPIEITTGQTLGAVLEQIISGICTALNSAGLTIVIGQASGSINPALPGQISQIQALIPQLKQILK